MTIPWALRIPLHSMIMMKASLSSVGSSIVALRFPTLVGKYIFGDIVNGRIFYVDVDDLVEGSQATINELTLLDVNGVETTMLDIVSAVSATRVDLRFGIDQQGEIYVMSKQDGKVRRLTVNQGAVTIFSNLDSYLGNSSTGCP